MTFPPFSCVFLCVFVWYKISSPASHARVCCLYIYIDNNVLRILERRIPLPFWQRKKNHFSIVDDAASRLLVRWYIFYTFYLLRLCYNIFDQL